MKHSRESGQLNQVQQVRDLNEVSISIETNLNQIDLFLRTLINQLKGSKAIVDAHYVPGIVKKIVGDIPYLNHIHSHSAKLNSVEINTGEMVFKIAIKPGTGSIACSVASLDGKQDEEDLQNWIKQLLDSLVKKAEITNSARSDLEELVFG